MKTNSELLAEAVLEEITMERDDEQPKKDESVQFETVLESGWVQDAIAMYERNPENTWFKALVWKVFVEKLGSGFAVNTAILIYQYFHPIFDLSQPLQQWMESGGYTKNEEMTWTAKKLKKAGIEIPDIETIVENAFKTAVEKGNIRKIFKIEDCFGDKPYLEPIRQMPASREAIQKAYIANLNPRETETIAELRKRYPEILRTVKKHPDYAAGAWTHFIGMMRESIGIVIDEKLDRKALEATRELMAIPAGIDRIPLETEISLELFLAFCEHRFEQKMRGKIIKLGSRTGDPAELTEENQAKLQAFAANLHAELTAKIQAVAPPELIEAYRNSREEDGNFFLAPAA